MALTQIEQLLIDYLSISKAKRGEQAVAYMTLQTEDQMLKMCQFLSENEAATGAEILRKAEELAK